MKWQTKWRMAESQEERFPSHLQVTAVRERRVGPVTQVIERVMIQPTDAYEHPCYRLLEVEGDEIKVDSIKDTLKEARARFDKLAVVTAATRWEP